MAAAREKVAKLEKVLEVIEGTSGAEVDATRIALEQSTSGAQEKPLAEQIAECKFVERAKKRLLKLERESVAESAFLEQGRARLVRLEAEAAGQLPVPPPQVPTAVSELEAEVSFSEAVGRRTHSDTRRSTAKKLRLREDFVPNTVEEAGCG